MTRPLTAKQQALFDEITASAHKGVFIGGDQSLVANSLEKRGLIDFFFTQGYRGGSDRKFAVLPEYKDYDARWNALMATVKKADAVPDEEEATLPGPGTP